MPVEPFVENEDAMITWTDAALNAFDRHNEAMRERVAASGADPDEVADDLRRHVEEELLASKIQIVTREDVERVLARMGPSLIDSAVPRVESTPAPPSSSFWRKLSVSGWIIVGLVSLTACLFTLFSTPVGHRTSAVLSIDDVVRLAQSNQVEPGTGVIRFGSNGDPLRAVITGRSTRPLAVGLLGSFGYPPIWIPQGRKEDV